MSDTLSATIGFDGSWDVFIADEEGEPYDLSSATLDAQVWRGDDQSPLFAPSVAAIVGQKGWCTLSWAIADLAGKEPGIYPLVVGVTEDGRRDLGFEGFIEIGRGPGSASAPRVYSSEEDLQLATSRLGLILPRDSGLAAGLNVRAEAREEADRRIADAIQCVRPGFVFRRTDEWDPVVCGYDQPDPSSPPPTKVEIETILAEGGLVVDERLREMCSWFAASLVFRRQLPDPQGKYRAMADDLMLRFEAAWRKYRPRIDTDGDDAPDIEIGRGTLTFLEAT